MSVGPNTLKVGADPSRSRGDDDGDIDDALGAALGDLFSDDDGLDEPEGAPEPKPIPRPAPGGDPARRPRLVVQGSGGEEKTVFFTGAPVFIGSGQGMDVTVVHPDVSRRHAAVVPDGAGFVLKDLMSSGHTQVNGRPISTCRLADGDLIHVGHTDIRFRWPAQPASDRAAAGAVLPSFDAVDEEPSGQSSFRRLFMAVGAVVLLATGVVLFSPGIQDRLMGGPATQPIPPLPAEIAQPLDDAYATAAALLDAGLHKAAARVVRDAQAQAAVDLPQGEALLRGADEVATAEAAYWDLWTQLAHDGSKDGRYALLMAEGSAHLAAAERAHLDEAPVEEVRRLAAEAQASFEAAQKVKPGDDEARKSAEATLSLVGRTGLREDDLTARLQSASLDTLMRSGEDALGRRRYREAVRAFDAVVARGADAPPDVAAAASDGARRARVAVEEARRPLVAAGDAARDAGRPVEARALYQEAQTLGPQDEGLGKELSALEPILRAKAQETFAKARELEQGGQLKSAWLLYRQVLEYVPDRTTAVYGDARARLEALARDE